MRRVFSKRRDMESMILTPRLALAASLVPEGARLADIGTDHGKLPVKLLLEGRVRSAIGSDIRPGPLAHAARNAEEHGVILPLRLAAGLAGIAPEECDTITIAGMGGETIADILAEAPWTRAGAHLLILQPMTMLPVLRLWLAANGYRTGAECLCREGEKFYLVIAARGGGKARRLTPLEALAPEALLADSLAEPYLAALLRRERAALRGMCAGRRVEPERIAAQQALTEALERRLEGLK